MQRPVAAAIYQARIISYSVCPNAWIHILRTNIVIDEKLMDETLRLTGLKTKRGAVELGLRTLIRLRKQEEILKFRGKLQWRGDLTAMRSDSRSWSIAVSGWNVLCIPRFQIYT